MITEKWIVRDCTPSISTDAECGLVLQKNWTFAPATRHDTKRIRFFDTEKAAAKVAKKFDYAEVVKVQVEE